jgi:hypothetical protein
VHKTPSYDAKMLLKVVFDRKSVCKKMSNNFKKYTDEIHSEQPKILSKIHTSLWILKISR